MNDWSLSTCDRNALEQQEGSDMAFVEFAARIKAEPTVLTAPLVLKLAQDALDAGQVDSAVRYVNMAYAIFDSSAVRRTGSFNASDRNTGRT